MARTRFPAADPRFVPKLDDLLALERVSSRLALGARRTRAAAGARLTPFHGQGVIYAESRPYAAGDERRRMDWRATARRGRPFTKLFQDERDRSVYLAVDLGADMRFASQGAFKSVIAAHAAALLAWGASAHGDRVGGWVQAGGPGRHLPVAARRRGVLPLLEALAAAGAADPGADCPFDPMAALERLPPGAAIVLASDRRGLDRLTGARLAALAARHEMLAVGVRDPLELDLPPVGPVSVEAGGRGVHVELDAEGARRFRARAVEAFATLDRRLARSRVRVVWLSTDGDPGAQLARALGQRETSAA